jgi:phage terminase large subunit-like protein
VAYAFSAEEPERLRGPQFEAAWADEFCIWPRPSETLAIPLAT